MMAQTDYIVIEAEEDGVQLIGLTRGTDTKFHHAEKLDKGEVMIAQFTEHTSAMKVRGKASIHTAHGIITSESRK
ncbi:Transcription attenuation protein MtrB [Metalysinibacillus saudimassiliensis]|uniref:Transcription attenuation protein MtrB n=2 Tax=Bacillales TaxID=1385 RepID=A0A078MBM2_9BACL|nr:Transcription attenuation protein MtrB [Metalysinibacillus saudimassiliensis]